MTLNRPFFPILCATFALFLVVPSPVRAEIPADGAGGVASDPLLESAPDYEPLAFGETPGAFSIYRDTRDGADAYIGVCFLGGNELAVRVYEPGGDRELLFAVTWYEAGGKAEPGTISIAKGSFDGSPYARSVLPTLTDLADAWIAVRDRFSEEPDFEESLDCGMCDFRYWVPVFRLYGAALERVNPATGRGSLALATAGIARSGNDPAFYAFRGFPKPRAVSAELVAPGKPVVAAVDGMDATLDSNWAEDADGVWRLSRPGAQDAAFFAESLNLADYGDRDVFDLIRLLVLNSGWALAPADVRIFVFNERPCVYYRVLDPETGSISVQYKMFVPRGASRFSMVSLSVSEPLYEANRDYFDAILF